MVRRSKPIHICCKLPLGLKAFLIPATIGFLCHATYAQEAAKIAGAASVALEVPAGTPLRLYLTRKVSYRLGEPVQAKFAEPIWAFDRIVIPAGTAVQGQIAELDPVSKIVRARTIAGGDFTPLKRALVSFMRVTLPDGRSLPIHTQNSLALGTFYVPPRPQKPRKNQKPNKPESGKSSRIQQLIRQKATQQATNVANARTRGFYDLVRAPNKREWLKNFLVSKLPYHGQSYSPRERFDAILNQPLEFGSATMNPNAIAVAGTAPPPDSVADMRFLTTISSADAKVGDAVSGVLAQPVFTTDRKLILPEGTHLNGKITLARRASLFHRGGKLRFSLDSVKVPQFGALENQSHEGQKLIGAPARAQLAAAEPTGGALKIDPEGTAQATESKKRLLRPAVAALVATRTVDEEPRIGGSSSAAGSASSAGGFALGGFSGFGFLGLGIAAPLPRPVGAAFGYYGLAWSVYSNVVSRGRDVTFPKNTTVAIRFGRPPRSHGERQNKSKD